MSLVARMLALLASLLAALGLSLPLGRVGDADVTVLDRPLILVFAILTAASVARFRLMPLPSWIDGVLMAVGAVALLGALDTLDSAGVGFWFLTMAAWLVAWLFVDRVSSGRRPGALPHRLIALLVPVLFGLWILILWELVTRGFQVPTVLLPPPSMIGERFMASLPILWADFQQTFLKAVLIGYVLGCGSGFIIAIAIVIVLCGHAS